MADNSESVSLTIPDRTDDALTGSAFAQTIMNLSGQPREDAMFEQFKAGNVPQFMRTLCAVSSSSMSIAGASRTVTFWVTPDYLCIGSDDDYLRCPMTPLTATKVADLFDGFLITRKMTNLIFEAADVKLIALPKVANAQMASTKYFLEHNEMIQDQLSKRSMGVPASPGLLTAGHKKDVVLCAALFDGKPYPNGHDDRVAIYGWAHTINDDSWSVWQGLNPTSHSNLYADYSHGIRVVAASVMLSGEEHAFDELICDPSTAGVLSDEGVLRAARYPNT